MLLDTYVLDHEARAAAFADVETRISGSLSSWRTPRSICALFLSVMAGTLALQAKSPDMRRQCANPNCHRSYRRSQVRVLSSPVEACSLRMGFRETSNGGQQSFDLPETAVRFGIVSKTELRFAAPDYFFSQRYRVGIRHRIW